MATWKQNEIEVLERHLQDLRGQLTGEVLETLQARLPSRSVAAIKKKALQIRGNPVRVVPGNNAWTEAEFERLKETFARAEGTTKAQKLSAIAGQFPGRSSKALAHQLRSKAPATYYGREEQHAGEPIAEEEEQRERDLPTLAPGAATSTATPTLAGARRNVYITRQARRAQVATAEASSRTASPVNQPGTGGGQTPDTGGRQTPQRPPREGQQQTPAQLWTDETRPAYEDLRQRFRRTWRHAPSARRKVGRIDRRKTSKDTVRMVSHILQEALDETEESGESEVEKRKRAKSAIYAAGLTLAQKAKPKKTQKKPKFIVTGEIINRLEAKITVARQLRSWHGAGKLPPQLKAMARVLRKARMSPTQYMDTTSDRIRTLQSSQRYQKHQNETQKTRDKFEERPAAATIRKAPRQQPSADKAESYYRTLYTASKRDSEPTPRYNQWLRKLRDHRETHKPEPIRPEVLEEATRVALKNTAPWKAPGEDGIPAGIYKMIPSAEEYLSKFVREVLTGERMCDERDARGKVVLLHKSGDVDDPANYRPIALLNADYKIMTAVISRLIRKRLPEWAIPKEQLAREGVWGTIHGLLQDKAITQKARKNRAKHYSAWVDFRKAYDSISHKQLRRLIKVLPIHDTVAQILAGLTKKWSVRICIGRNTTKPVYVKCGVYQGDTISPLLFTLITAFITREVMMSDDVNEAARGRQEILAYMDDLKVHASTKRGITAAVKCIRECASEVGLEMNQRKCGVYARRDSGDEDDEDEEEGEADEEAGEAAFLPRIREGYRYLGILQLELDTEMNLEQTTSKALRDAREILESNLAAAQKVRLINSTVVPAATYVLGNMFSANKRTTILRKCRDLDRQIRGLLVEAKMKTRSTSTASVYLDKTMGGLGLRALEEEVELQYVRKGTYLKLHPDLAQTRAQYAALEKGGWKNPKTDCEAVLRKYAVDHEEQGVTGTVSERVRKLVREVREQQQDKWMEQWKRHLHYGRIVCEEAGNINFYAYASTYMDSWRISMLHAAAEDQIQGLGAIPANRKMCSKGCGAQLTAYHVASACLTPEYNTRHDIIVAKILRAILDSHDAPDDIKSRWHFARATMTERYMWGEREVRMRAGVAVRTSTQLNHNKPDILITISNPSEVYVIEVAISHLQNIRVQEKIKRTRYEKNSMADIHRGNVDSVERDSNVVGELRHMYQCPVQLAVVVIGVYGETLDTPEMRNTEEILVKIGVPRWKIRSTIKNACYSSAVTTTNILTNRLAREQGVPRE